MALELHVWGPAFSLPSIDAHCLAAIAYLQQAVPRGEWQLIASSNPALSPTNELPALRNGDIWIGGFRNIFHYIAQYSAGDWVLDAGLPEQEGADCIAFSSFLESHGQPLLDLSLYVSSENYSTITRPIYNTIQSFPLPYLTPGSIRASAKARTEHLGLSGLDIDTEEGSAHEKSIIPESLRHPKNTVSSLLAAAPEVNAQIRLNALATAFFEPLQALRGEKRYFVSSKKFSSLDCLILGYLSLMLVPELPQPWLANAMRKKFPGLCNWTEALIASVYGPETTLADAFPAKLGDSADDVLEKRVRSRGILPWKSPDNGGVIGVGATFLASFADSLPVVGQLRRNTRMKQHGGKTPEQEQSGSWQTFTTVGSLITGVGLFIGYALHSGLIVLPSAEQKREEKANGLGAFGEAGAALGLYAQQIQAPIRHEPLQDDVRKGGVPVAEIDVEVDVR